jgi:hypothetical protein
MAQWFCHLGSGASRGMGQHCRGLAWLQLAQKRHSEAWRLEGPNLKQAGFALHTPWLGGEKVRHENCGGHRRTRCSTHKVDCYKNRVALEVEWNNKDPFFDRDLNNFRLLFDLRAIDAGIIITRCTELQQIFNKLGRGPSFGNSTTHMAKLLPRLEGGSGGGCPVVVFGIRGAAYVED